MLLIVLLSTCALLLLVGSGFVWRATRKLRELRRLYSTENIALECASAIACLNLEKLQWLKEIRNPGRIQASFIAIVQILEQVGAVAGAAADLQCHGWITPRDR